MQEVKIALAPEGPADWWEIEALYDLCFAPGRTALSSYRLRENRPPAQGLNFTARDPDAVLAGVVRNWVVDVDGQAAILLGPIAVHPTRQGEGIAALLMVQAIDAAQAAGWARMLLVGDLPFYKRFGFAPLTGVQMPPPTNPQRILGLALQPGAWDDVQGRVTVPKD